MGIFSGTTLCQALLLLSVLNFPANTSQIWEGTGRVISGVGKGGSVELRLEIDGAVVTSVSGPPLHGTIQTTPDLNGTIETQTGTWDIERCGEELCVNLQQYHPQQTIFYRLMRKNL